MNEIKILIILLINITVTSSLLDDYCERDEHGSCKVKEDTCDDEDEPCFYEDTLSETKPDDYPHFETLSRLDGVKVGHVQEHTIDGIKMKLITKSLKPLLFEIPNAITDHEIEHAVNIATNQYRSGGMFESIAKGGLTPEDTFKPTSAKGRAHGPAGYFENWDLNEDGRIDLDEVRKFCRNYNFLYFKDEDVKEMLQKVDIKEFDDGFCSTTEFTGLNTMGIENYLNIMMREHPKWRQRFSEQTWLPMSKEFDPTLSVMRERFGKLLKIPHKILLGSEHMQVVSYVPGGHYHAHHDSETEKAITKPCCHHTDTKTVLAHNTCRLCRFMTVMFYLQAPEEGGETAFLAADNITYSDSSFRSRGKEAVDLFNLSEHCHDANLVVTPKRGTAIVWYNHHVDPSGWLGKMDDFSIHGGCDVKKGNKWIANLWLTAPYKDNVDKLSMYSMEYLEKTNEEQM